MRRGLRRRIGGHDRRADDDDHHHRGDLAGDGGGAAPGPTVVRVDVVDGAPEGGIVRETVEKDDRVLLVVASDVADEVHLHGYDISREVTAGGTVRMRFRAALPGRFEVELENRGVVIADLAVAP